MLCSLVATIKQARPELLADIESSERDIIRAEPPAGFFDKQKPQIEDIGEPQVATFFTLSDVDPTNWCVYLIVTQRSANNLTQVDV